MTGIPLSNDMGNTLISNAAVRSFRATTYNLGNALSGTVLVDTSLGDVQMGTVTGNVTFQFAGWAPTNTESAIKLRLNIANTTAHITFPSEASLSTNLLENNNGSSPLIIETAPYGASVLEYELSTLDCGNSILIDPVNRPWQTTQVVTRNTVTPTGYQGDKNGDVCVAPSIPHVTVTETVAADDTLLTLSTSDFYENMPIVFTGTLIGGVVAGTTYYVKEILRTKEFSYTNIGEIKDHSFRNLLESKGVKAIYNIPLKTLEGKVIGILGLDYVKTEPKSSIDEMFKDIHNEEDLDCFMKTQARIMTGYLI